MVSTILLVEDTLELAQVIVRELNAEGYRTLHAIDGTTGLALHHSQAVDLIILDWMLPGGMDGVEVLRRVRQRDVTPVLMLTARTEEIDRVVGLEVGADDYLTKPFGMRELIARVRAMLRRVELIRQTVATDRTEHDLIQHGTLMLAPDSHRAALDGEALDLTPTEFSLLYLMLRNPGRAFSRRYLIDTIWGETYIEGDRAVDSTMMRLRKKLGGHGDQLETVRGIGYRWRGAIMKQVSLRRAFTELTFALAISSLTLFVFKNALTLQITFRQLLLLLMPGLTVYFAVRLRLPAGKAEGQFRFELLAYCLLLLMQGAIVAWVPLVAPNIPVLFFVLFMLAIVTVAFWATRVAIRFWPFWNRLRQSHLAWALTHAHMLVALVLVGIGFIVVVITLAIVMPDKQYEPLSQLLLVLPFSLLIISPSILGLIAFLGVSSIFSYFVMRPTVQRLQNLVATTDQLSEGNYAARSPVIGKDEVMRLQVNFNRMAAELEHTVRDLRSERDSVNKLLQLRRELMTSISHELRTPIATLRAYTEALLDRHTEKLPEPVLHDLRVMVDEVSRLQTLVDDLFTLARSETRQLPLRCEPTDVGTLVTHVVEAIVPLAWNSYRVQVAAEIVADSPSAQGDSVRIEQILRNLIQNSLQHTPPGGIVTVEVGMESGQVRLSVEDTGDGIDPVDLPYIWERFYRGKNTSSPGSGLGLALVKELTEAMNGSVDVQTKPKEWSRFTILLPGAELVPREAST